MKQTRRKHDNMRFVFYLMFEVSFGVLSQKVGGNRRVITIKVAASVLSVAATSNCRAC